MTAQEDQEEKRAMTIVDDLPVGQSCRSTGRTISEGEFMLLHNLMGAMTPLHANKHYMENTEYGERILGGGVVVGLVAAGWANAALNHSLIADYGVRWRAALGLDARFVGPVQPGDTLYFVYTLNAARESKSRPGCGVMTVEMKVENQRDEVCSVGTLNALFDRPGLRDPGL
jgi:acyl dehydratase